MNKPIHIDTTSPTWESVTMWAARRLNDARKKLERSGLAEREADELRGEIKAMKDLLGLPEPKPVIPDTA